MRNVSGSFNRRQFLAGGAAVTAAAFLSDGIARAQVATPPQPVPPFTPQSVAVTTGGITRTRTFLVHCPPVVSGKLLPAVIAYHGAGQNARAISQHWL